MVGGSVPVVGGGVKVVPMGRVVGTGPVGGMFNGPVGGMVNGPVGGIVNGPVGLGMCKPVG